VHTSSAKCRAAVDESWRVENPLGTRLIAAAVSHAGGPRYEEGHPKFGMVCLVQNRTYPESDRPLFSPLIHSPHETAKWRVLCTQGHTGSSLSSNCCLQNHTDALRTIDDVTMPRALPSDCLHASEQRPQQHALRLSEKDYCFDVGPWKEPRI
jgi:hypothetical protein